MHAKKGIHAAKAKLHQADVDYMHIGDNFTPNRRTGSICVHMDANLEF